MTISVTTLKQYLWLESNSFISIWEAKYFVERNHIFQFISSNNTFFSIFPYFYSLKIRNSSPSMSKSKTVPPHFGAQKEKYTPLQMSIEKSCQIYEFKCQSITSAIVRKMMKKRKLITEISLDNELLATSLRPWLKLEGCHALLVAIWTSCDTYNDPKKKKWKQEYWTPS